MKRVSGESGFSLMEITVTLAILGIVTFAGLKVMRMEVSQEVDISQDTSLMVYVKTLENQIMSQEGCEMISGKAMGEALAMPKISPKPGEKKTFEMDRSGDGKLKVESLEISELIASSENAEASIARITLKVKRMDSNKMKKTDVFMPVYTEMKGGKRVVEGCNLSFLRIFQYVKARVCEESMGTFSQGVDCPTLLLMIQLEAAKSICADLYGAAQVMKGLQCDLSQLHAGKLCPAGQKLRGFDANAGIICG